MEERNPSFYRNMPFDEFVEAVYVTPDEKADIHFRSQHLKMCRSSGEYIADYIGQFETLADDFSRVMEEIGVEELDLPHVLHSGRDNRYYANFYNDKLRDLVSKRFHRERYRAV